MSDTEIETLCCPVCGHDGQFDAQGFESEPVHERDSDGTKVTMERRFRHRCPECDTKFLIVHESEVQ